MNHFHFIDKRHILTRNNQKFLVILYYCQKEYLFFVFYLF